MLLEMGFYCGLASLYPYGPVYCPTDSCMGDCRGVYMYNSKSAPLPATHKLCVYAGPGSGMGKTWFQWKPRDVEPDRQKYLGKSVCMLEDRGEAKDINELEREQ